MRVNQLHQKVILPPLRNGARRIVIVGGGPGGCNGALVAAREGAKVTLVSESGLGGAAVQTNALPARGMIRTGNWNDSVEFVQSLGVIGLEPQVDMQTLNRRLRSTAAGQSEQILHSMIELGIEVILGRAHSLTQDISRREWKIQVTTEAEELELEADCVLVSTGVSPQTIPGVKCDGRRILNYRQLYSLIDVPEDLIIVGSGVTGVEFASAFSELGSVVTLILGNEGILPGWDEDAADMVQKHFQLKGINTIANTQTTNVRNIGNRVEVELDDGRILVGSHCLLAVGGIPNTGGLGLDKLGLKMSTESYIEVDSLSKTSLPGIYAAGDCTGKIQLAPLAAEQGRIAAEQAMGKPTTPLRTTFAQAVFTSPEIAVVGLSENEARKRNIPFNCTVLPIARNLRSQMQGVEDGFIKLLAAPESSAIIGALVVADNAAELVFGLSIAISYGLKADQLAGVSTVYPSWSEFLTEAAKRLPLSG